MVLLTVLAIACLAWSPVVEGQQKMVRLALIGGVGAVACGFWFLKLDAIPKRLRLACLAAIAGLAIMSVFCVRLDGINGNMVPFFTWSWSPDGPSGALLTQNNSYFEHDATRIILRHGTPQDSPQFLGPHRLGVVQNVELASNWERRPPRIHWKRPIGAGWSSFAVVGDYAVTQEQRDNENYVVCYEVSAGIPVWSHHVGPGFMTAEGGGPRSTPAIFDGRVFALGPSGWLVCLDGSTGRLLWRLNVLQQAKAEMLREGIACSPLVVGGLVVVSTGSRGTYALAAYDQKTGERIWTSGHDDASYSSPTLMSLCGVQQIVVMNARSVSGHSIVDGTLLWDHPWGVGAYVVSQPLQVDPTTLFLSSGQGVGASLLRIDNCSSAEDDFLKPLWPHSRTLSLKPKFSTPIVKDGHAYGVSDPGILVCIDLETGEACWKQGRYGHAQLVLVGDYFLVMAEDGELAMLDMTPDQLTELGQIQLFERRTWHIPTVTGNRLLARNDREAVCVELPLVSDDGELGNPLAKE